MPFKILRIFPISSSASVYIITNNVQWWNNNSSLIRWCFVYFFLLSCFLKFNRTLQKKRKWLNKAVKSSRSLGKNLCVGGRCVHVCAGVLTLQAHTETRGQHCLPVLLSALLLLRRVYIYLCFCLSIFAATPLLSGRRQGSHSSPHPPPASLLSISLPPAQHPRSNQFISTMFYFKSPTKGKVNKWAKPFVITAPETLKNPTKQEITDGSAIPGGTYSRGNKWHSIDGLSDWACRQAPSTSAHKDFVYLFDTQWTLQILVGDIRLKSSNNVSLSRVKIKTTLL